MLNKLIQWSLSNRGLIIGLSLLLLVLGYQSARQLPVEVLPDLTKPQVTIRRALPRRKWKRASRSRWKAPSWVCPA